MNDQTPQHFADTVAAKDAWISDCGQYRYTLTRRWDHGPMAWWVMLNPSTADAMLDDPTIRRCASFSRREGAGAMTVVNLYALRATDPADLARHREPRGEGNLDLLVGVSYKAREGELVVVAWGAHPMAEKGSGNVNKMFAAAGAKCLGRTKAGHPRHPLYVKGDQPLVPWRVGAHIDGSACGDG